jgi:hypothetical protein
MWDMTSGSCQHTLIGHNDPVWSVCFSPCDTKIVSGGGLEEDDGGNGGGLECEDEEEMKENWGGNGDFSIRIWNAETGTQIGSPLEVTQGKFLKKEIHKKHSPCFFKTIVFVHDD